MSTAAPSGSGVARSDASFIPLFAVFVVAIVVSLAAGYLVGSRHAKVEVETVPPRAAAARYQFTAFGKQLIEFDGPRSIAAARSPSSPSY